MPDATGLELIAQELRDAEPESVLGTVFFRGRAEIEIAPGAHPRRLWQQLSAKRLQLPREPARLSTTTRTSRGSASIYELLDMQRGGPRSPSRRASPIEEPQIESVVGMFPGADFPEREVFDMFGVVFDGHPDLRRILMPEDYEGFPQRRDFPVGGEPVLFTFNEEQSLRTQMAAERLPQARGVDHDVVRAGRAGPLARAADAQHRTTPPRHARRAAADRDAGGRGRPGHQADHRLRPHRHREDRRAEVLLEGDPGRRADGLPELLLQRDGVLRRRRDAARAARSPRVPSTCA